MESADQQPLLPSLKLDELLDELQVRLQAVLSTRDRVYSLLEAVVAVGSSLELEVLLRSIVETAVSLVDARYGAMGVIGEGDRLVDFIPVGLTADEITSIHHWPEGKGLLGLLVTEPRPLRLADIKGHEASFGFPAGHPPMKSFLGVPIRIRGEVYGNLYLTEKQGSGQFDTEDEAVAVALAAAAGVAIENARLYEEARRQQRWLSATAEVTSHLLSGAESGDALSMITEKALEMTGADIVMVSLPMADGRHVRVEHAAGVGAEQALGLVVPIESSVTEQVIAKGERMSIPNYRAEEQVSDTAKARLPLGPLEVVPLGAPGKVRGVLSAGRQEGAMPLSAAAADMLATFAAQAAIGLELAEHRRQAEQMAVFEDRDRIAKDLHDLVIQRLYATGMSLQGVTSMIRAPEVADRVSRSVDALDDTIKEIRSAAARRRARHGGARRDRRAHAHRAARVAVQRGQARGSEPGERHGHRGQRARAHGQGRRRRNRAWRQAQRTAQPGAAGDGARRVPGSPARRRRRHGDRLEGSARPVGRALASPRGATRSGGLPRRRASPRTPRPGCAAPCRAWKRARKRSSSPSSRPGTAARRSAGSSGPRR